MIFIVKLARQRRESVRVELTPTVSFSKLEATPVIACFLCLLGSMVFMKVSWNENFKNKIAKLHITIANRSLSPLASWPGQDQVQKQMQYDVGRMSRLERQRRG